VKHLVSIIGICVGVVAANVRAAVTFDFVGPRGYAGTDVSANGSVIVGNVVGDGSYETFRWTQASGAVPLGRATVPVIGTGAGSPDVSYDGSRVSATIIGDDNYSTTGLWENGSWSWPTQLPPGAAVVDSNRSDAWGLSGDGNTVVGLYWKSPPGGSARGLSWKTGNPGAALASSGLDPKSSRANATNYDGTVAVGWQDYNGPWQPCVWISGVQTILDATPVLCMAQAVDDDGSVIVGDNYNAAVDRREAALWRLQGGQYVKENLGVLPGTPTNYHGRVWAQDVSGDGSIVVGVNRFYDNGPYSDETGFIWT